MLTAYQTALMNLVQAPSSPQPLIPVATQTLYINTARNQVAADAECIRTEGTLTLVAGTRGYGFSGIAVTGSGVASVFAVRSAQVVNGIAMSIYPWEWFAAYYQYDGATGSPTILAVQQQGSNGTLSMWKTPAAAGQIIFDVVCLPIALATDSDPEAIPYAWTDAVPFYAAWLAFQGMQRQADADKMLQRYQILVRRGREMATPSELPGNLPGGPGTEMAAGMQTLGWPPQGQAGR